MVTETIYFNYLANILNRTRKDLMLLYPEELLRYLSISQSRMDVTSFVICLNLISKHSKQPALQWSPLFPVPLPPPQTYIGNPQQFAQWVYGFYLVDLQSLLSGSVFLNLSSSLIFITNAIWSMEIHSSKTACPPPLVLCYYWHQHKAFIFIQVRTGDKAKSVTTPGWNYAKKYWHFM